jgi:hypothetical protein
MLIVGAAYRRLRKREAGVVFLLDNVSQFVGEKTTAQGRMRRVLTITEDNFAPNRVGLRVYCSG